MDFNQLIKNLKKDFSSFSHIGMGILGDTSTPYLAQAIRACGYEKRMNIRVWDSGYDTIDITIHNSESQLYTGGNEYVILFFSLRKLQRKFYTMEWKENFAEQFIGEVKNIIETVSGRIRTNFIVFNFPEEIDPVFGNFGNKTPDSFIYQVRKINYLLMTLSGQMDNVFVSDISALHAGKGSAYCFDQRSYTNADVEWSLDFTADIGANIVQILSSFLGFSKKCLILDLDNTLWGGIIGDDGVENIRIGELGDGKSFGQLQQWAKALKERGIILAICSSNNEGTAKEPFLSHPEMILRWADIAVFVANWDNKVDNIKYIQSVLNIGFDSMVFLDDNAFERELVKAHLPEITVPDLPEDPAEFMSYLSSLNLFETISYTAGDKDRTNLYRQQAHRTIERSQYTNDNDFLTSLGMVSGVKAFDAFSIPRVAQLTQRSNQFNLRTIRYSEEDIRRISGSDEYVTFSFDLSDRFGDHGLICVVIMKKNETKELIIDTWIMSCRVLKRGVENFVLSELIEWSGANGFERIIGQYIPTAKNGLVRDHYERMGFHKVPEADGYWTLSVSDFQRKEHYIARKT